MPSSRPTTRILGFPVHIRPGFVLFMVLIVLVNNGAFGVWLAIGIAAFTLLHELGHALAARSTGAQAEISLDFLAGYASYVPTRPLSRWERAGIALAGPGTQIAIGLVVLLALGVQPFDRAAVQSSDAAFAIWWSGPMLGLVNLLPVLPLDGGTVAATALDRLLPGRGQRIMATVSLPLTLGGLLAAALADDWRFLTPFLVVLLVLQLQSLSDRTTDDGAPSIDAHPLRLAEESAWATGETPPIGHRAALSPWFRAHVHLRDGRTEEARRTLLDGLVAPSIDGGAWWPPRTAPVIDLERLTALLPRPLPDGNPYAATVLVEVLLRIGHLREAADYGARCYSRSPSAAVATLVARSVAVAGEPELALRWLETALLDADGAPVVADAIDHAPELRSLRWRADVHDIRRRALSSTP